MDTKCKDGLSKLMGGKADGVILNLMGFVLRMDDSEADGGAEASSLGFHGDMRPVYTENLPRLVFFFLFS